MCCYATQAPLKRVFVKHECPRWQQSPKFAIFTMKVMVKITSSLTLVSLEKGFIRWVCMPNMKWNKRPKGPHIVHLSTMCHLFDRSARAAIFVYSSAWKQKLGRRHWDLASCQVSLNSVQRFQRRSRKCLSQSDASTAILFFFHHPEKHKFGRGRWFLASCQFLLN